MNSDWKDQVPDQQAEKGERMDFGRELAIDAMLTALGEANRLPLDSVSTASAKIIPMRRHRSKSRVIASIVAMACSLSVVGTLYWMNKDALFHDARTMTVLTIDGQAEKEGRNGKTRPLEQGDVLLPGEDARAIGDSSLMLAFADGTQIELGADAVLRNLPGENHGGSKTLRLERGELNADVAPQPDKKPLRIHTPYAMAQVIGTRFTLAVRKKHAELNVSEGKVGFIRETDETGLLVDVGQIAGLGPETEWIEENDPAMPVINGFALIDIASGEPLPGFELLKDNQIIPRSVLPASGVNIEILTGGRVNRIWVKANQLERIEKHPPFSVAGDQLHHGRSYNAMDLSAGTYHIQVTPMSRNGADGATASITLNFK